MPVYSIKIARKDINSFWRGGIKFGQTPILLSVVEMPTAKNEITPQHLKILQREKLLTVTEVLEETTPSGALSSSAPTISTEGNSPEPEAAPAETVPKKGKK
jgi:hypothetical protein